LSTEPYVVRPLDCQALPRHPQRPPPRRLLWRRSLLFLPL